MLKTINNWSTWYAAVNYYNTQVTSWSNAYTCLQDKKALMNNVAISSGTLFYEQTIVR